MYIPLNRYKISHGKVVRVILVVLVGLFHGAGCAHRNIKVVYESGEPAADTIVLFSEVNMIPIYGTKVGIEKVDADGVASFWAKGSVLVEAFGPNGTWCVYPIGRSLTERAVLASQPSDTYSGKYRDRIASKVIEKLDGKADPALLSEAKRRKQQLTRYLDSR